MLIGSDGPTLGARPGGREGSERLVSTFEHAPLAVALVGPGADDRLVYANPALSRLTGYGRAELERGTLTLADLVHPDDRDAAAGARRTAARGDEPSSSSEVRLVRADGRSAWVVLHCWSSADGRLVVQLVDVTERRRTERELSRSNAELASFAYLAAHELKAPLQSLTGFTALLDRVHGPQLDPQAREFVSWILDGATRMDSLVDALLAYCVVDRSETVLASVSLQAVLCDALGQLERDVSARKAAVSAGELPVVTGDPVQLCQLLQNLLANALKFVPEGRAPQITVSAERGADGWTITVADNGIGVEDEAHQRIFTMFERLHPRERYKGTGIGLSICKRIVERRGGSIWVEPNVPVGSRFRFSVPDLPAASPRTAA